MPVEAFLVHLQIGHALENARAGHEPRDGVAARLLARHAGAQGGSVAHVERIEVEAGAVDLRKGSKRQIAGEDPVAFVQQQARSGEANAAASARDDDTAFGGRRCAHLPTMMVRTFSTTAGGVA